MNLQKLNKKRINEILVFLLFQKTLLCLHIFSQRDGELYSFFTNQMKLIEISTLIIFIVRKFQ